MTETPQEPAETPQTDPDPQPPAAAPPSGGGGDAGDGDGGQPSKTTAPAGKLAWLRELTTTAIAAVVVWVVMLMLWYTFKAAGPDLEKMKDVMLYGLTILGSVIGFYFGRVPAERRAEAAEDSRNSAEKTARKAQTTANDAQRQLADQTRETQEAQKKLNLAKTGIAKVTASMRAAAGTSPSGGGGLLGGDEGGKGVRDTSMEAYVELEALSRIL